MGPLVWMGRGVGGAFGVGVIGCEEAGDVVEGVEGGTYLFFRQRWEGKNIPLYHGESSRHPSWVRQTYASTIGGEFEFFEDDLVAVGLQRGRAVGRFREQEVGLVGITL